MEEIKVALFGVGGYAANYLHAVSHPERPGVRLVGAVDPYITSCDACPVYATAEEMFAHCQPDLTVVATPIHFHPEQAVAAFAHGSHVLLEKPMASTMAGVEEILRARDRAGRKLGVGFQLCADKAVRALKRDVDAGVYGAPVSLKVIVLWPRDHAYYHRSCGWAGKRFDPQGRPIFDNVLSNATAHYLINMLFLTGRPLASLDVRTFRANAIETFDTAVLKGVSEGGAKLFIAVSHATDPARKQSPVFEYTYEKGVIRMGCLGGEDEHLTARTPDGSVKDYGLTGQSYMPCFWNMVDAIRGEAEIACPGETAALHVDTLQKMRALEPDATPFPDAWIREQDGFTWVPGLNEKLVECFKAGEIPRWNLAAEHL